MSTPRLLRGLLGASIAGAGLSMALARMTAPSVLNADAKLDVPNPAWIDAPYEASFLFGGHYRTSTRRKTWLKARRRWKKKLKASLWPKPRLHELFLPDGWEGEVEFHKEMTHGLLLKGFPMAHLLSTE